MAPNSPFQETKGAFGYHVPLGILNSVLGFWLPFSTLPLYGSLATLMFPAPSAGPSSCMNTAVPAETLSVDETPKLQVKASNAFSASIVDLWFPVNENVSTSWPPTIDFSGKPSPSPDAMEGIIAPHPRVGHTRSTTRSIPNRPSRSNSLRVPTTPTNLWQQTSDARHVLMTRSREPASPDKCPYPPIDPSRIRPYPSTSTEAEVVRPGGARCGDADRPSPAPVSTCPEQSVLTLWEQAQHKFSESWHAQRKKNPHLPLVVSPFNPLRADMPPSYWKSVNTTTKSFDKIVWNIKRPLPSPAVPTRLRSRKGCDMAGERLLPRAVLTGKLRHHCRVCGSDGLWKRLLLVNYWGTRADAMFEDALRQVKTDDDDEEMADSFPEAGLLRDRHDFDDEDDDPMDDPLVVERHSDCYPWRLF
ncbi:hypothetical protein C8R46DRAFT_1066423 [Mycena filopes]|nr:hypothetical protein C8R46DRAFT_1066423 [Mycena filopes]